MELRYSGIRAREKSKFVLAFAVVQTLCYASAVVRIVVLIHQNCALVRIFWLSFFVSFRSAPAALQVFCDA
jgi:hypothetical protein